MNVLDQPAGWPGQKGKWDKNTMYKMKVSPDCVCKHNIYSIC